MGENHNLINDLTWFNLRWHDLLPQMTRVENELASRSLHNGLRKLLHTFCGFPNSTVEMFTQDNPDSIRAGIKSSTIQSREGTHIFNAYHSYLS